MMLIDSHAHLEMPEFKKDLEAVLQRAKESGVEYIFTVGTEKKDGEGHLRLPFKPFHLCHPGRSSHNAKEIDDQTYPTLRELCREKKVKAYGEIGLDFFRNLSPRDVQLKRFREQIALAKELRLPIVVHDREAHQETLEILKSEKEKSVEELSTVSPEITRWREYVSIWVSTSPFLEVSHSRMQEVCERSSRKSPWNRFLWRPMLHS